MTCYNTQEWLQTEDEDMFELSGVAEFGIERGEGQFAADGEFEVSSVVEGEAVTLGEEKGGVPSVAVSFRID